MAHIIINASLSAAIGYNIFFNPPKFAVVIAILEPANSTRTDNSYFESDKHCCSYLEKEKIGIPAIWRPKNVDHNCQEQGKRL